VQFRGTPGARQQHQFHSDMVAAAAIAVKLGQR